MCNKKKGGKNEKNTVYLTSCASLFLTFLWYFTEFWYVKWMVEIFMPCVCAQTSEIPEWVTRRMASDNITTTNVNNSTGNCLTYNDIIFPQFTVSNAVRRLNVIDPPTTTDVYTVSCWVSKTSTGLSAIIIRSVMLVSGLMYIVILFGQCCKKKECCFQNEKIKNIVGCYSVFLLIFTLLCITRTSFFIPFLGYIKDMEVGALEEDPDSRKLFAIELQLRQLVLLVVQSLSFFCYITCCCYMRPMSRQQRDGVEEEKDETTLLEEEKKNIKASTKTASSKYVVSQKEEEDDNDDDEDDSNIEKDDEENKIQEEDMMQIKELESQLHKVISVDNDQESEEDLSIEWIHPFHDEQSSVDTDDWI